MGCLNTAWDWLFARPAEAWAATASWATVLIGLATVAVAGLYAKRQVDEARRTREEQAQPNVAVFMESNPTKWMFVEFVIKNFGLTPAYEIEVTIDPEPDVSPRPNKPRRPLSYPKKIKSLMPGQEWRTGWDYGPKRIEDDDRTKVFSAKVTYTDSRGHELTTRSTLDWGLYEISSRLEVKTIHDIHAQLKDHTEAVQQLADGLSQAGSADHGLVIYDGGPLGEEVARREEAEANHWRRLEALSAQEQSAGPSQPTEDETAQHSTPEPPPTEPEPPAQRGE